MSESFEHDPSAVGNSGDARAPAAGTGDTEEIDALPVLASEPRVVRAYPATGTPTTYWRSTGIPLPAVQAAAAAAGGFVAGAAVVGFVHRHRQAASLPPPRRVRSLSRGARQKRGTTIAGELIQIVGSRSLLVDVHLLGARDPEC